jgi:hypothetical protein
MIAAMGVRYPARVTAGGGLYLEHDGRDVPDVGTIVADFEEGCQLLVTSSTITGYPLEQIIRGRLGAVKFVKGGFQVFRDDPHRGASFPPRHEQPLEPHEFVASEPPKNETESLWEDFLEAVRTRRQSTFSPPDLAAPAVALTAMAEQSYRGGQSLSWDRERRAIAPAGGLSRSQSRNKPNQIAGWSGGENGSTLEAPGYQKLAGPWVNGKEPII